MLFFFDEMMISTIFFSQDLCRFLSKLIDFHDID